MGIFDRFRRKKPQVLNSVSGSSQLPVFGRTSSGKFVDPKEAMGLAAVYASVRCIAETVAGLPLHLYRTTEAGGHEKATDHSLYRLLHDEPNEEMSAFSFWEAIITQVLLYGNGYANIVRANDNTVLEIYPLLSERMKVDRDPKTSKIYYEYRYASESKEKGEIKRLDPKNVLHVPGLNYDGIVGISPIAQAKNALGMGLAVEEFGATFFREGAALGGVLEVPGTLKDPDRLRNNWNANFAGSGKVGKTAVLEEGIKYSPITIPPEQAQFIESMKWSTDQIARIFRLPPHKIGDLEHATFSNIEEQSREFVQDSIAPWCQRCEGAMNRRLLSVKEKEEGYYIRFNLDGLQRGNYQTRMSGYSTAIQNGFMSPNDVRALENMERIPPEEGGDTYMCNGNMVPLRTVQTNDNGGQNG